MHSLDDFRVDPLAPQFVVDVNPLDDQDLALELDLTPRLTDQPALTCVYLARLQRAPEGSRQSTAGGGDNVVQRGGIGRGVARVYAVVLRHLRMDAEGNRILPGGKESLPHRSLVPYHLHLRDIDDITHQAPPCVSRKSCTYPERSPFLPSQKVFTRRSHSETCPYKSRSDRGEGMCSGTTGGVKEIDRESEVSMDTWVIVLIVIAVIVIAAAVYWSTSGKAKKLEQQREQAAEHREEAHGAAQRAGEAELTARRHAEEAEREKARALELEHKAAETDPDRPDPVRRDPDPR